VQDIAFQGDGHFCKRHSLLRLLRHVFVYLFHFDCAPSPAFLPLSSSSSAIIFFLFYSFVVVGPNNDVQMLTTQLIGCGFFSGGLAAAITCPLDVVKTRMQVNDFARNLVFFNVIIFLRT